MNSQQPVYLFAGGRGRSSFSTFSSVRRIIKSCGKPQPEIAYIGAASLKDNRLVYWLVSSLIKADCPCRIRRVVTASHRADLKKARDLLARADVVFFSGGDVEGGTHILKEKDLAWYFRDLYTAGKVFMGVSAGSIMLCREWVRWRDPRDDSSAELFPCLGLVPLICDTHAEGDGWVELKTALQLKGEGALGYGITSGACLKIYPGCRLEAESGPVARFTLVDARIERLPDLLPA